MTARDAAPMPSETPRELVERIAKEQSMLDNAQAILRDYWLGDSEERNADANRLVDMLPDILRLASLGASLEGATDSKTWPYVLAFAREMEKKLAANRHKGDREGWIRDEARALFRRLKDEAKELDYALRRRSANQADGLNHGPTGVAERVAIAGEAADVANFAMMIADVCGGLPPSGASGEEQTK